MGNYITDFHPESDTVKFHAVKAGFFAMGRALQSASHFENDVIKEITTWNNGFTFSMDVLPGGPSLVMRKQNRTMKLIGFTKNPNADLIIELKNLDTAFRMITTQAGAHQIYAEHKIGVIGNISDSMKLIRLIYIIEGYLFPKILSKNILKQTPTMTLKKHFNRMRIYTLGMFFGK
jgi:hypothetical protein